MNNLLNFSKMQALGNDFMVINAINQSFSPSKAQIRAWSNRNFGVGFDQLLIIRPPTGTDHDYFYQIYNANGEEVGQCGNGARCAAVFIHQYISPKLKLKLKTISTLIELEILEPHLVKLNLPAPQFEPKQIPLIGYEAQETYSLNLPNHPSISFHAVNVGNPHAIILIDDSHKLAEMSIEPLGQAIERHPIFPEACNVNFMSIKNPNEIDLRVWERGCGETLACGSGALASAATAIKFHKLQSKIKVNLPGGELWISWPNINGPIEQVGPAFEVFQGKIST